MIATVLIAAALYVPVGQGGPVTIQVNAPADSWGIRQAARTMDDQLAGVTFRTSGDCATVDACVTVVVGWFEEQEEHALSAGHATAWGGLTTYPTDTTRTIYLNRRAVQRWDRRHVAAHELGHVLGLAHHDGRGVTAPGDATALSRAEVRVLDGYYR